MIIFGTVNERELTLIVLIIETLIFFCKRYEVITFPSGIHLFTLINVH